VSLPAAPHDRVDRREERHASDKAREETLVTACPAVARPPIARALAPARSDPRVRVMRSIFHAARVLSR